MIAILENAVKASAAGELGERELLAISLAVNAEIPSQIADPNARALYGVFAKNVERDLLARSEELKRGES